MTIQSLGSSLGFTAFSITTSKSAPAAAKASAYDSDKVTISNLRSKLQTLSDKLQKFQKLTSASDSAATNPLADPAAPPAPSGDGSAPSVSVSFDGSHKFEKKIQKALQKGFDSEDSKLITGKSSNVGGKVNITVQSGGTTKTVSIDVDSNTTVKDFVQSFNDQAGGAATASVTKDAHGKSKISIDVPAQAPADNSTPPSNPIVLGGSGDSAQATSDASSLLDDLKGIVKSINDVVKFVQDNNGAGSGLSLTAKDEQLIGDLSQAVQGAKSSDGSVSLSSFLTGGSNGSAAVKDQKFVESFVQNQQGVQEVLGKLADAVGGSNGIIRKYTASDGGLAQGYQDITQQRAKFAEAKKQIEQQTNTTLSADDLKALAKVTEQVSAKA